MVKTVWAICFAAVLLSGLLGQSLSATTVVVGPSTCQSAYKHFSTIQSAVSSVGYSTTVMVCPGFYPEQVVISQPLTLEGVTDGTGNAAVVQVPGTGLVQNGTSNSFGPVTVQLLVQNTVGVTIKNLVVDGNGGNCPAGSNRNVGIGVFDVGAANDGTTAARIENVVVRNDTTCLGDGILADTSYITITNSEIHDVNQTAIDAFSATFSITNNSIQRAGAYGIVLFNNASGSVASGNNVSDGSTGILSEVSKAATITNNTLLNDSYVGIWTYFADNQTITNNVVSNSAWPLAIGGGYLNTVQNNKISDALYDGIIDYSSSGGNNITKNTVNEAQFGIFADGTTGGDTLVPNTFYSTVTTIDPGPPQIPTAPVQP
ncbi:MAG TPA: right-handed parallel beta-helix repeat-containing protein [Terriglobales bacterium]